MILVIDNYDSFVYNLARYVTELGKHCKVIRNDQLELETIEQLNPSHIIISPGPCTPNEAGLSCKIIETFGKHIPILGVCLGHQAIGQVMGATITHAIEPRHGKPSIITHNGQGLFNNIPTPFTVGRYHSLIISNDNLPDCLEVTATSEKGEIMAVQHKSAPVYGLQFHPESILTEHGYSIIKNFLSFIWPI